MFKHYENVTIPQNRICWNLFNNLVHFILKYPQGLLHKSVYYEFRTILRNNNGQNLDLKKSTDLILDNIIFSNLAYYLGLQSHTPLYLPLPEHLLPR